MHPHVTRDTTKKMGPHDEQRVLAVSKCAAMSVVKGIESGQ
jgi:hypothetical protein